MIKYLFDFLYYQANFSIIVYIVIKEKKDRYNIIHCICLKNRKNIMYKECI